MGKDGAAGGGFYFLGFLGSAIYYIQAAEGFWPGVGGFVKALFWPAFVTYDALSFMNA